MAALHQLSLDLQGLETHTYVGSEKNESKEKKLLISLDPTKRYTQKVSGQGQILNVNLPMHDQISLQRNCIKGNSKVICNYKQSNTNEKGMEQYN